MFYRYILFVLLLFAYGLRPAMADLLKTHINTVMTPAGEWSYIIFNDEPAGSPNYIYDLQLTVNAPIEVTATPPGWAVDTDNISFVFWFNTDLALPYPHDIAPGSSVIF